VLLGGVEDEESGCVIGLGGRVGRGGLLPAFMEGGTGSRRCTKRRRVRCRDLLGYSGGRMRPAAWSVRGSSGLGRSGDQCHGWGLVVKWCMVINDGRVGNGGSGLPLSAGETGMGAPVDVGSRSVRGGGVPPMGRRRCWESEGGMASGGSGRAHSGPCHRLGRPGGHHRAAGRHVESPWSRVD
jgi:hypothetical protein